MSRSEALAPVIYNVTLTSADTEYSQLLTVGSLPSDPYGTPKQYCKYWSAQCQTAFDVRWAFVTGKVATPTAPYATIKSGQWYNTPEKISLGADFQTIYLASSEAGVVVELICWMTLA